VKGTLAHGLYIAESYNIRFVRLNISYNYGNGITVGSHPNQDGPGEGATNEVDFADCIARRNGRSNTYDGVQNVATGYGFGIIGHGCTICIRGGDVSGNGGPGLYVWGHKNRKLYVHDLYTESNCASLTG